MGWLLRAIVALELLAVGIELGTRSAFVTGTDVGLGLGLAAPAAVTLALPGGWWRRFPFALGWSATVGWFSRQPAAGDIVVPGDARGYALVGVALAVLMFAVATLRPLRPPTAVAAGAEADRHAGPARSAHPDGDGFLH